MNTALPLTLALVCAIYMPVSIAEQLTKLSLQSMRQPV